MKNSEAITRILIWIFIFLKNSINFIVVSVFFYSIITENILYVVDERYIKLVKIISILTAANLSVVSISLLEKLELWNLQTKR